MTEQPAFYCVADARYFLGAVAMINSLRLNGHREPIYLLDAGLSDDQRELLAAEVTIVKAPSEAPPYLLKTVAPLAHPAEVMVLIDVDMIVCRSLGELIERAAEGRIVAFGAGYDRFVAEWAPLLGLGELRRHQYVTSALLALDSASGLPLLDRMDELRDRLETLIGAQRSAADPNFAFFALDQDLLNALLGADEALNRLTVLDPRLAPALPLDDLRLSDDHQGCVYPDGVVPFAIHHLVLTALPVLGPRAAKPWIERQPTTLYSRLLSRYLLAEDLPLRVAANVVPVWLRDDARGRLARLPVDARERAGWIIRDVLPRPLVERLDARRRRRVGLYR